jgi:predicted O-methyltransferase YrrM
MDHIYSNIDGWFDFPGFYSFLVQQYKKPNNAMFVEVGSWKGRSASYLAVEIINSDKPIHLYCVDTWKGSHEHFDHEAVVNNTLYQTFLENTAPLHHILTALQMTSLEGSSKFADNSVEAVFIDASHDHGNVIKDIEAWYPKVAPGGILGGHDHIDSWPGVITAVQEFAERYAYKDEIQFSDSSVWYIRKKSLTL